MRPVAAILIAASLLAMTAGSAAAQSPSVSPVPEGPRTEVPEHGFAVTFPSDWTVLVGPEEWPTTEGRQIYTSAIPIFRSLLYAYTSISAPQSEQCEVQSFAYPHLATNDIAYSLSQTLCDGMSHPAQVSLPAGEGAQLNCQRTGDGHSFYQPWYMLAADPGYLWLWCRSHDDRPDDHWSSVAETLEFLPVE